MTNDQIAIHLADFADNGVIDNPIPEIFAWPARGNPFSLFYNGFEIPSSPEVYSVLADFFDVDDNGVYNPEKGDYPLSDNTRRFYHQLPLDQITFTPFHSDTITHLTHNKNIDTEACLMAYTFDCDQQEFVENSVFLEYHFINSNTELTAPVYYGLYADFDIGNPFDDYLGTELPAFSGVFAFNSDTLFDQQSGTNPPVINLSVYQTPLDSHGINVGVHNIMPIHPGSQFWWADLPINNFEFYNYLSGLWRDGSPLTVGGNGWHGNEITDFPFPGHPADSTNWSELSANNLLEDRSALISFKVPVLFPKAVNRIFFSLSASNQTGISSQLNQIREFKSAQNYFIMGYPFDMPFQRPCLPSIVQNENQVIIFPNPATDHIKVQSSSTPIEEITLFNMLGHWVGKQKSSVGTTHTLRMETASLSPGVYMVSWRLRDGTMGSGKAVVGR
ncbi:MAG: T9SS type A sorting domain-containing protein [Lewinellaceae bacterium]|nr:T9SS type A sorting domain-containing protein [Lewinellaceae bacterium]